MTFPTIHRIRTEYERHEAERKVRAQKWELVKSACVLAFVASVLALAALS